MKRLAILALFALAIGAIAHLIWVEYLPRRLMHHAMETMGRKGERLNQWIHARRASPEARVVVRPSPDLMYSICVLDLRQGDVRLRVHPSAGYWSVAVYAPNSDNLYTWNDRDLPLGVDLVLSRRRETTHADTVSVPFDVGIVAVRRLAGTEAAWNAAETIRKHDICMVKT